MFLIKNSFNLSPTYDFERSLPVFMHVMIYWIHIRESFGARFCTFGNMCFVDQQSKLFVMNVFVNSFLMKWSCGCPNK